MRAILCPKRNDDTSVFLPDQKFFFASSPFVRASVFLCRLNGRLANRVAYATHQTHQRNTSKAVKFQYVTYINVIFYRVMRLDRKKQHVTLTTSRDILKTSSRKLKNKKKKRQEIQQKRQNTHKNLFATSSVARIDKQQE